MADVNWWLVALAFLLAVVLTWALTVRRVNCEVPVNATKGAAAGGAAGFAGGRSGAESEVAEDESAATDDPDDG
ncbi:hypothetical protein ACAG26_08875 [Mycobacterium sp. pUA109]|uniref:channel accessory protein ArfC n=1 Tax=Mycobacterium sp. pUA109 TaxID=3238982 RepID=UPI00351AC6F1